MKKLRTGILGATGMVGQRFITLLADHPWFELTTLAASPRSEGLTYEQAVEGRWKMDVPIPEKVRGMKVMNVNDVEKVAETVDFVFSAVDMKKEEIKAIEEAYAKTETPVVSNNSAHRWTPDVPMVIPEINSDHYKIIDEQKKRLGTKNGFIAVKPNCSIQSYVPALEAWMPWEPYEAVITTYQAISGAGKDFKSWPEMVENLIPYIGGEEAKSEDEPLKIWGHIENGEIVKSDQININCQCLRVPVLNGQALEEYKGFPQENDLPMAPAQFIKYFEEDDRPQVKLDVDRDKGMGISIGRLREDKIYDWKFIGLSHNTLRGAAGGGVLGAETLYKMGYIKEK